MAAAAAKAAAAALSTAGVVAFSSERAYADGGAPAFRFPGFSAPPTPPPAAQPPPPTPPAPAPAAEEKRKVRNDHPRTSAAGFDPEALERGAAMLKQIENSPHGKKVGGFRAPPLWLGVSWPAFLRGVLDPWPRRSSRY